ncbi:Na/Pi cotransporter family protein [Grimontia sp. S25]|uniref:Na/Pi cotransporter family protein n=1 Tax=Grimontia sedimenti TaxID=2711294 RepID=A0A6M1RCH4_9GAMM|nr:Na/Pi symporter [Grimontia sedimenti]NGN96161.1 Na/Pi cotransporter family protein [Grimontia sedimenti]
MAQIEAVNQQAEKPVSFIVWLKIVALVYLLLLAVGMIGTGFKWATGGQAKELFEFASNPFTALIIGTVCTALIQSSSTVTSIIVGMVAGGLPVATAIPMVMGANIGTTITNTLVSLGHVRDKEEFKRAFAAATVHDFFNLISVVIFLPLEIATGFLQKISAWMVAPLSSTDGMSMGDLNFMKAITKPIIKSVQGAMEVLGDPWGGVAMILLGIGLIFVSITFIGKLLKVAMVGKAKQILHNAIGRGPVTGIFSGTIITILVQSSSTTTSLAVPLVGSGVFKVRDIYPFTLGANIGTCVTALLAATAVSGELANAALQISLVHLVYNVLGVVVIFGIPLLREIPLKAAAWLGNLAAENKLYAVGYILFVFFVIPLFLILLS